MPRRFVLLLTLVPATTPALAWEVVGGSLPSFVTSGAPAAGLRDQSGWSAMTAPAPGGFGAASGFEYRLGGGWKLGVSSLSAAAPPLFAGGLAGIGFNRSDIRLGYDLGRLTPFVTAGQGSLGFGGASAGIFTSASDPLGLNAFSSPTKFTSVGAGFTYSLSDNVSFTAGVSAARLQNGWGQ